MAVQDWEGEASLFWVGGEGGTGGRGAEPSARSRTPFLGRPVAGCLVALLLPCSGPITGLWQVTSSSRIKLCPLLLSISRAHPWPPWGTRSTTGQLKGFPLTAGWLLLELWVEGLLQMQMSGPAQPVVLAEKGPVTEASVLSPWEVGFFRPPENCSTTPWSGFPISLHLGHNLLSIFKWLIGMVSQIGGGRKDGSGKPAH